MAIFKQPMKPRAVFLFYHGLSHVIAILKVGRILEHAGYEVYFAGAEFFRQYVSLQGFKFKVLKSVPFGLGFETWVRTIEKEKYIYWAALRDRITDRLYSERDVELYWMLEEVQPGIIFIDSRQATDFIILYRHLKDRKIKAAIMHAMLPADAGPDRPPLNTDVFPNDRNAVKKAVHRMKRLQFKTQLQEKFIQLGFDDQFLIKRRLKKNSIPRHYVSRTPGLLKFSVKNVDEFVLAPREFDFPNFTIASRQHYVGFMTNETLNDKDDAAYSNVWPSISHLKESKNLKLIFCSFGTIEPSDSEVIFSFIDKLTQVTARQNYILVLALKAKHEDVAELRTRENIYIFNFVPQLQALKHADVFITHGGLNSIREAICAEVPMLLYPIHPEYDPIGNAARIAYHQLGLRGKASTDTVDDIVQKLEELLSNPLYKRNIQKLKFLDLQQYTPAHFMEKLNSISPISI
jgi:zeaxanthin glucosyltransferase